MRSHRHTTAAAAALVTGIVAITLLSGLETLRAPGASAAGLNGVPLAPYTTTTPVGTGSPTATMGVPTSTLGSPAATETATATLSATTVPTPTDEVATSMPTGTATSSSTPTEPPPRVPPVYLPYLSKGSQLVQPTPTRTPSVTPIPSNTPIPTETPVPSPTFSPGENFAYSCRYNRNLEFCTWLSAEDMPMGSPVTAFARLLRDGQPLEGVTMSVRWTFPYPIAFMLCDAESDALGVASCSVTVPHVARGNAGTAYIQMNHDGLTNQKQISFRFH